MRRSSAKAGWIGLPPRGHYRVAVTPLVLATLSDRAFRLYHVIAAYGWQYNPRHQQHLIREGQLAAARQYMETTLCDLTDEQLGSLLGCSRQWANRLLGELKRHGLLAEHSASGGRRLLEPQGMDYYADESAASMPATALPSDSPESLATSHARAAFSADPPGQVSSTVDTLGPPGQAVSSAVDTLRPPGQLVSSAVDTSLSTAPGSPTLRKLNSLKDKNLRELKGGEPVSSAALEPPDQPVSSTVDTIGPAGQGVSGPVDSLRPPGQGVSSTVDTIGPVGQGVSSPVDSLRPPGQGVSSTVDTTGPVGQGVSGPVDSSRPSGQGVSSTVDTEGVAGQPAVDLAQGDPAFAARIEPLLRARNVWPKPAHRVAQVLAALGEIYAYDDPAIALQLFAAVVHVAGALELGVWRLKQLVEPGGWTLDKVLTTDVWTLLHGWGVSWQPATAEVAETEPPAAAAVAADAARAAIAATGDEITAPPVVHLADGNALPPQKLWQRALEELELQMTRATFDTWLRGTVCLGLEDAATLIVSVRNGYAVEWLENRLYPVIRRTLYRIAGAELKVRFVVWDGRPVAEPAALYQVQSVK